MKSLLEKLKGSGLVFHRTPPVQVHIAQIILRLSTALLGSH